jgi:hypothetical protein
MKRIILMTLALPLIITLGVVEGLWTDRWVMSSELEAAIARLGGIPRTVGPWQGEDKELEPGAAAAAGVTGYVQRRYVNSRTGDSLFMLLMCGRPGPISIHTPDLCWPRSGYAETGPARLHEVSYGPSDQEADFWVARFGNANAPVPDNVRVYWSWNATNEWLAPKQPRVTFARHRALYKLYISRQLPRPNEPLAEDPCLGFLRLFLPEVNQALFGESELE